MLQKILKFQFCAYFYCSFSNCWDASNFVIFHYIKLQSLSGTHAAMAGADNWFIQSVRKRNGQLLKSQPPNSQFLEMSTFRALYALFDVLI